MCCECWISDMVIITTGIMVLVSSITARPSEESVHKTRASLPSKVFSTINQGQLGLRLSPGQRKEYI